MKTFLEFAIRAIEDIRYFNKDYKEVILDFRRKNRIMKPAINFMIRFILYIENILLKPI